MASLFNTKVKKIIGGATGVAAVGGLVFYLYPRQEEKLPEKTEEQTIEEEAEPAPVTRKSISEWLKDNSEVILLDPDNSNDGAWKGAWDVFNFNSKNASDNWKGLSYTDVRSAQAPQNFRNLCKINSTKEIENIEEQIYQEVKKFCTKDKPKA